MEGIPTPVLDLPVLTVEVRLVPFRTPGEVAPFPASALRGAIGRWTLAHLCPAPGIPCVGCEGHADCAHGQLFFPAAGEGGPRNPPPPWALWARWSPEDRDLLVGLQTYGRGAGPWMNALLDALADLAPEGRIDGVPPSRVEPARLPDGPSALRGLLRDSRGGGVRIELQTPVSLKVAGRELQEAPTLEVLVAAARRRALLLAGVVRGAAGEGEGASPRMVIEPLAPARQSVRPVVIRRWSERQGRTIWLRGIRGAMVFDPVPALAARWLSVGEVLGVGGDPAHGFGRIRLYPV